MKSLGLLLLGVLLAPPVAGAERARFSTSVEVVRVDVSVLSGGRPVRDLKADNFDVWDEGVRQQVEVVGQEATAIHAVLALDTSQSVEGVRLQHLKRAAHAFVDALRADDSFSLITFAECASLSVVGSRNREEAHAAIDQAFTRRTTGLRDAVVAALAVADPRLGRPLVLVFSDGEDVGSFLDESAVMALANDSDAVVDAILPGSVESPFLTELADVTGGRTAYVVEEDKVSQAFLASLNEFRSRYRLRYEPHDVPRPGWHRLKVRVVNAGHTRVRARLGYRRQPD